MNMLQWLQPVRLGLLDCKQMYTLKPHLHCCVQRVQVVIFLDGLLPEHNYEYETLSVGSFQEQALKL